MRQGGVLQQENRQHDQSAGQQLIKGAGMDMHLRIDHPVNKNEGGVTAHGQQAKADAGKVAGAAGHIDFELHHHRKPQKGQDDKAQTFPAQAFTEKKMCVHRSREWSQIHQHDGIGHGGVFHGLDIKDDKAGQHGAIDQHRPGRPAPEQV